MLKTIEGLPVKDLHSAVILSSEEAEVEKKKLSAYRKALIPPPRTLRDFLPEDVGTEAVYIGQSQMECSIIPHMTKGKKYTVLEVFKGCSDMMVAVENDSGARAIFMAYRFRRLK